MGRHYNYYMGDFETTVFEGQTDTRVWASAIVKFGTEDVIILHSIEDTYNYLVSLDENIVIYYHNLKFDGSFWMSFLMCDLQMQPAYTMIFPDGYKIDMPPNGDAASDDYQKHCYDENGNAFFDEHQKARTVDVVAWQEKDMQNNTYQYSISDMGQWYRIKIKTETGKMIEIRDSLKLLPFSVKKIGNSFGTKHKKLEMEYTGLRYPGCEITPEERQYIANDVLVVKEALEIMQQEGHKKLTIGSCCLDEYRKTKDKNDYRNMFPNLYEYEIDKNRHGEKNAGEWIRHSYKGGWCYLVKGKENKIVTNGTTADVNSLYPSMMSSESGNIYPVGEPHFWTGSDIPEMPPESYWFVRIKTRFKLKPGYLPFVQIKGNFLYKGNECLTTSDVYDPKTKRYYDFYYNTDDILVPARLELTLTMTDYTLLREHYTLTDFEILDGCWFYGEAGIFDLYIEKYKQIKLNSTGAKRELAKLFLNNLYGKMASSPNSSFKVAKIKDDGSIGFYEIRAYDKKPGYIPVGSAITSYARNFTIRAAQKNYHGPNEPGFIYADTDSIHCDLSPDDLKGIHVHDKNFCCWKLESSWDYGLFVRQKTYIEHVVAENLEPIEKPYYNVKCAGMPQRCKQLFLQSVSGDTDGIEKMTEAEKEFISQKREITDFRVGLTVPGKLLPKRIPGGVLLLPTTYEMRPIY